MLGQWRAFFANLQGAAFVFEHFLMPFMKEHVSKLDPAFKGAEGTLRSVRTSPRVYCSCTRQAACDMDTE